MKSYAILPLLILALMAQTGCEQDNNSVKQGLEFKPVVDPPKSNWKPGERSTEDAPQEGTFDVLFETSKGNFTMRVHRDWAPRGAERFYQLIKSRYYDGCPLYRVIPDFVVQFGINGDPKGTQYWNKSFPDEEVKQSNLPGLVSYAKAGRNSRTTQIFINYENNFLLDDQKFAPFAEVIDGMEVCLQFNSEYGNYTDQEKMSTYGNDFVFQYYSKMDYIIKADFVESSEPDGDAEGKETDAREDAGEPDKESPDNVSTDEESNPDKEQSDKGQTDKGQTDKGQTDKGQSDKGQTESK